MNTNVAQLRAGGSALLPIYPTSFEDVVRFARMAIMAGMVKPQKTGWGDNQETEDTAAVEARATMIIMQGMELGLPPMQSVQLLAMINGRITAHSEAVPGILLSKGFKIDQGWSGDEASDDWKAVCKLTRPDGEFCISEFSVRDAKRAGLWSPQEKVTKRGKQNSSYETPNDSPWHKYPKRMLWARALGFAAKDKGADAMRGLMVREEVEDMILSEAARDITPLPSLPALEIPDVPDQEQTPSPVDQTSQMLPDGNADDAPIADADGFIAKLADDIALCDSAEELAEVSESNASMIARLPKKQKAQAKKMLAKAAE